ncbi:MAG TPA: acyl carrier protein [Clostridium sp.]|nr:acyl carrier protein [Clostridium sp.]
MEKILSSKLRCRVMDIIKANSQYDIENINESLNIRTDLGIDSIQMMSLVMDLENEFEIEIEPELLTYENFSTVEHIIRIIFTKKLSLSEAENEENL